MKKDELIEKILEALDDEDTEYWYLHMYRQGEGHHKTVKFDTQTQAENNATNNYVENNRHEDEVNVYVVSNSEIPPTLILGNMAMKAKP